MDLPTAMSPEGNDEVDRRSLVSGAAPSLAGLRVLVVEDEADSRELFAKVLTTCGADVTTAASCEEALALIRESAVQNRPHVILSDLGMPQDD
jgi:CheY-like chemotaxis protein